MLFHPTDHHLHERSQVHYDEATFDETFELTVVLRWATERGWERVKSIGMFGGRETGSVLFFSF